MASSARIDELRKKFDENPRRYFAPLANEFRKAGDLEQAVFICQEYLPQQPGHMSGHIVYGQALFELGRDEEAKAVFETALSLDPENLIALRHLGDIARQAGDVDVARFWYQRVLESDPRNEEIAQVLMSLDAMRGETAPPADRPPDTAQPEPQPVSAPVEMPPVEASADEPPPIPELVAAPEPESFEPFEGFDRTIDFDQPAGEPAEPSAVSSAAESDDSVMAESAPELTLAQAQPEEEPVVELHAAEEPAAEELLDLDDFSIGGETIEAAPKMESTSEFAEPEPEPSAGYELEREPEEASSDIGDSLATFEPEPLESAAAAEGSAIAESAGLNESEPTAEAEPEPEIELASDIILGLPSDEPVASTEFLPEQESAPEFSEASVNAAAEPSTESAELRQPAADFTDEVFATETMANLYVQQGHLAGALEIYEKLAAHNPGDATLQDRIREIKERIYGKREGVWEPESVSELSSAAGAAAEPSIREFLRSVIARRAVDPASSAEATVPESATTMPPETPSETVSGSIDALFANAAPTDEDRSAANALAQAFGEWPEPTPIRGVPAHEASSELSLDHVFKANAPVPRRDEGDAFSFDQFFSDELGEGAAGAENEHGQGAPENSDDIAQFNAWLSGLKKT